MESTAGRCACLAMTAGRHGALPAHQRVAVTATRPSKGLASARFLAGGGLRRAATSVQILGRGTQRRVGLGSAGSPLQLVAFRMWH